MSLCDIIRVKRSASCGQVNYSSSVHILRSPWSMIWYELQQMSYSSHVFTKNEFRIFTNFLINQIVSKKKPNKKSTYLNKPDLFSNWSKNSCICTIRNSFFRENIWWWTVHKAYLDSVIMVIEKLTSLEGIHNRIVMFIYNVMCGYWRHTGST